jgi:hypothetical protein
MNRLYSGDGLRFLELETEYLQGEILGLLLKIQVSWNVNAVSLVLLFPTFRSIVLYPDDEGTAVLRNFRNYNANDKMQHARSLKICDIFCNI